MSQRARNGNFVYYERPGVSQLKALLKSKSCTIPEIVRHYVLTSEWLWNVLDPRADGKVRPA